MISRNLGTIFTIVSHLAFQDTPTRMAYRRVLRMMEDPDQMATDGNIFDDELDEDGNAIQKGDCHPESLLHSNPLYGSPVNG